MFGLPEQSRCDGDEEEGEVIMADMLTVEEVEEALRHATMLRQMRHACGYTAYVELTYDISKDTALCPKCGNPINDMKPTGSGLLRVCHEEE
jgi:hypothetical protein